MPKRSPRELPPVHPGLEWVGARIPFPLPLKDGKTAVLQLFAELPSHIVVGTRLDKTEAGQPLSEFLLEVALKPMVGPARLPGRIRVADEAAAADLQSIAGLPVKIAVAPTPEIDEIVDDLRRALDAGSQEEDYLSGGTIDADAVGALFRAATVLHTLAPWKTAGDYQLIQIDAPQLNLHEACVSIIGNAGESFGFVLFPSLGEYERFLESPPAPGNSHTGTWRSLNFVPKDQVSKKQLAQIKEHGWEVAGRKAYPAAVVVDGGERMFPGPEDIAVLRACTTVLVSFLMRNGAGIFEKDQDDIEPLSQSFTGGDGLTVRLTYPLEAASLYDFDENDLPPQPVPASPTVGRNDPCPCGSGKKYKKCCQGKPRLLPPAAAVATDTVASEDGTATRPS